MVFKIQACESNIMMNRLHTDDDEYVINHITCLENFFWLNRNFFHCVNHCEDHFLHLVLYTLTNFAIHYF